MLFPGSEMGLVPARASPFERPRPSGEQAERLARRRARERGARADRALAVRSWDTRVQLTARGLTAAPAGLLAAEQLVSVNLARNAIAALPEGLGRLKRLRKLVLSHNRLAALPADLGALAGLEVLRVDHNCLAGVPQGLGALVRLEELNLDGNPLTDDLPGQAYTFAAAWADGGAGPGPAGDGADPAAAARGGGAAATGRLGLDGSPAAKLRARTRGFLGHLRRTLPPARQAELAALQEGLTRKRVLQQLRDLLPQGSPDALAAVVAQAADAGLGGHALVDAAARTAEALQAMAGAAAARDGAGVQAALAEYCEASRMGLGDYRPELAAALKFQWQLEVQARAQRHQAALEARRAAARAAAPEGGGPRAAVLGALPTNHQTAEPEAGEEAERALKLEQNNAAYREWKARKQEQKEKEQRKFRFSQQQKKAAQLEAQAKALAEKEKEEMEKGWPERIVFSHAPGTFTKKKTEEERRAERRPSLRPRSQE